MREVQNKTRQDKKKSVEQASGNTEQEIQYKENVLQPRKFEKGIRRIQRERKKATLSNDRKLARPTSKFQVKPTQQLEGVKATTIKSRTRKCQQATENDR